MSERAPWWLIALLAAAILTSCGQAPPPVLVCPLVFEPPSLCIRRHQCCWVSPYDGLHCEECCE
jgi:hypothetical protein